MTQKSLAIIVIGYVEASVTTLNLNVSVEFFNLFLGWLVVSLLVLVDYFLKCSYLTIV